MHVHSVLLVTAEVRVHFIHCGPMQLMAYECEDQLKLTATGLVFRMKVCAC